MMEQISDFIKQLYEFFFLQKNEIKKVQKNIHKFSICNETSSVSVDKLQRNREKWSELRKRVIFIENIKFGLTGFNLPFRFEK